MSSETALQSRIVYVQDQPSLQSCIEALKSSPAFAFDLEFDRDRYTYGFDLCLIQIATAGDCFVVDPLAKLNLQPLFKVFEDCNIRKLVHCPGEDLRLFHSLQCYPNNLVDTEVYAKLLNYEQTSLSNMLLVHCDVVINKKLQTSNWGRRPLSQAQIDYAAADVLYLFELEAKLLKMATAKGLMPFVEEEIAQLNATRYTLEPKANFLKKNDLQFMSPYDQYVLNELFKWRDQLARQKNKPAHQMMAEEVLRQIAYGKLAIADLPKQQGIHPSLKNQEMVRQLHENFERYHAEAKAASFSRKRAGQGLTMEEKQALEQAKQELETIKKNVFQPIQQKLSTLLGEHAARFIFSSTLVNDILKGDTSISNMRPAYRIQLVKQAAADLQLDISAWM